MATPPSLSDYASPEIAVMRSGYQNAGTSISMPTTPADVSGGGDPVGPSISYERDFAPLARRFFQQTYGSGMSPRAAAESFGESVGALQSAYVNRMQIRALDEQSRNRRVQYDSAVFALESARDKARKERELISGLTPLQMELDPIVNNPGVSAAERRRQLGVIGVRNAALIGSNDLARVAYEAASRGITEESRSKLTVKDFLSTSGGQGAKYLTNYEKEIGRPLTTEDEIPVTKAASWLSEIENKRVSDVQRNRQALKDASERNKRLSGLLGRVSRVQLEVPESLTGTTPQPVKFKDPSDEAYVDSVIQLFATPEELKSHAGADPAAKLSLAKRIDAEVAIGSRGPATDVVKATVSSLTSD